MLRVIGGDIRADIGPKRKAEGPKSCQHQSFEECQVIYCYHLNQKSFKTPTMRTEGIKDFNACFLESEKELELAFSPLFL